MGEIEQRTKAILERDIAFDLAADVANDASEPGAQEFELAPRSLLSIAPDRTEASRQEVPINPRHQTHQRMSNVDDLLQRWTKQIVLTIVARLAHRSPRQRIPPAKESRTVQIRNPKTRENR